MVDTVRMDQRPKAIDIALGEDLLKGSPCDGLEIFGHDRLPPRRVRITALLLC
jgi:hypothetical protein